MRDLTKAQYLSALERNGLKNDGFMGYVRMPDGITCVCSFNGGNTRRARLAYVLKQAEKYTAPRTAVSL